MSVCIIQQNTIVDISLKFHIYYKSIDIPCRGQSIAVFVVEFGRWIKDIMTNEGCIFGFPIYMYMGTLIFPCRWKKHH